MDKRKDSLTFLRICSFTHFQFSVQFTNVKWFSTNFWWKISNKLVTWNIFLFTNMFLDKLTSGCYLMKFKIGLLSWKTFSDVSLAKIAFWLLSMAFQNRRKRSLPTCQLPPIRPDFLPLSTKYKKHGRPTLILSHL